MAVVNPICIVTALVGELVLREYVLVGGLVSSSLGRRVTLEYSSDGMTRVSYMQRAESRRKMTGSCIYRLTSASRV